MTEVLVAQQSQEWFDMRRCVPITASSFGDALGVGRGKPYDFLASLLAKDDLDTKDDDRSNAFTEHGNRMEPVINEAYQLLTGLHSVTSGFWLPEQDDLLYGLVGASPDAKVYNRVGGDFVGLAEFKAPVFKMYNGSKTFPHGVPRQYIAQMQGQMAVCGKKWCDFMAVCVETKQIMLNRVYFQPTYWLHASTRLRQFCKILKEAKTRKARGLQSLEFEAAQQLKNLPMATSPLPGERSILVEDMLDMDDKGRYCTVGGLMMNFDFLLGIDPNLSAALNEYAQKTLQFIDKKIDFKGEGVSLRKK